MIALLAAVLVAQATPPSPAPIAPGAAPTEDSRQLWAKKCASCHGESGKADTRLGQKLKIDDLSRERWQKRHPDAFVRKTITNGVKGTRMAAYKDKLTSGQIESLIALIRTFQQTP